MERSIFEFFMYEIRAREDSFILITTLLFGVYLVCRSKGEYGELKKRSCITIICMSPTHRLIYRIANILEKTRTSPVFCGIKENDLLLIQKPYDGRGAVFSSTELFSSRIQSATHALQLLSNVSDLKLVRKWGTAHRLGPENGGSSIRVISGKSGAERNIRVRNGAIDSSSRPAFSPAHKNGAARSLSETKNNQK